MADEAKKADRELRPVFIVAHAADGVPFMMVGLSRACFDDMAGRHWTRDFDMTKAGIPLRLALFAAETHDECRKLIEAAARTAGVALLDETRTDFSIPKVIPTPDVKGSGRT